MYKFSVFRFLSYSAALYIIFIFSVLFYVEKCRILSCHGRIFNVAY